MEKVCCRIARLDGTIGKSSKQRQSQVALRLYLVVAFALALLVFAQKSNAQSDERDRRTRDNVREKNDQRRGPGSARFRLPVEIIRFRTLNGTMNNAAGFWWGAAGVNLRRLVPSDYADGIWEPSGATRKPARSISNYFSIQHASDPNARGLSSMVWQWGQFLDHDITLTETAEPVEAFPVIVPTGDRYFDPTGAGGVTMQFFRSEIRTNRPVTESKEQINSITAWIDGSNVYGSDDTIGKSLRTLSGGLLKTSEGNLLPVDDTGFFLAGDVRANEQVGLTSMHTIFMREHNRVARQIGARWPALSDEQIYVRARKHVGALMQIITYNEFLPAIMGEGALREYRGYNPLVYPNVTNTFSTAAYRFGHSMLNEDMLRLDNSGNEISAGSLSLAEAFFNPANLTDFGVDPYLKGLVTQQAEEVDTRIVNSVRNFLFGPPGSGGFDLAALNIQRGRDHGLADFNSIRRRYRLPAYSSTDQISSDVNIRNSFRLAYSSVDDIDPWVGFLSEDHVAGASIGPTLKAVFQHQFEAIRDGDRFWYERDFSGRELIELENTTLADVIERNSGVRGLQRNVFFIPSAQ